MHLLAARPGGFTEQPGIVDLGQTSADMVILAAADSSLSALADAVEQLPRDESLQIRLANWLALRQMASLDRYINQVLGRARLVVVSLLGGESYWQYGLEQLCAWAAAGAGRTLVVVPGDDAEDPQLMARGNAGMDRARMVWRYLRAGGRHNATELLHFCLAEFFGRDCKYRAPRPLPMAAVWHPQHATARLEHWQHSWNPAWPVLPILFYRSHLDSANTGVFNDLIQLMRRERLNPLPLALASLKDAECLALVDEMAQRAGAAAILNTTGFAAAPAPSADGPTTPARLFRADIPVIQAILASTERSQWRRSPQGLVARDICMQVALPEMDGRLTGGVISFKEGHRYARRSQIQVVRYRLHKERARSVLRLCRAQASLGAKPHRKKRLALVLANYPCRDGRIGNGVGLDTPASAIAVLRALAAHGFSLGQLPEDGAALMELLLGGITNNPDSMDGLPCHQSIALADYSRHFGRLPARARRAVVERWGEPQEDPRCRGGRLMVAGVRLGEIFVGIQPPRGYGVDLQACYHDPDLVPPHSYLAFYFWMRHHYRVDALVQLGKHGNLEWLPGKGAGLSGGCWPDAALGPVPHFYPFIVNDPGEGAQAKRRAHAAVVDHLMPPMVRAELYGELAQLESLVDEFYEARGMDEARTGHLRRAILEALERSDVAAELGGDDEDDRLARLDAFLCEIKEAQIRGGLHILGRLPPLDALAETLVALLRLPGAAGGGVLHALAADLGLADGFDPLAADAAPWDGPRPEALRRVCERPWRTAADTRERLELLALQFMRGLDSDGTGPGAAMPRTKAQLDYARGVLMPALEASAKMEIASLLRGLDGRFIPPGPSGAPTRGRLDSLPTGRNFYGVDNRCIPSPAAWELGQKSAQALLARHLQEHGEYPRHLGLSVWGTATMRTGGDDIAQAFALMGVRPVRAPGSQRVVDFEIIPFMLLERPRVDVTLRISGLFRDAFANVIALYDSAVCALAQTAEPPGINPIAEACAARQAQLQERGLAPEAAARQARYRIFGSKPGAYGAGLQHLMDERCWKSRDDLAAAWLNWGGYAYGQDLYGAPAREHLADALGRVQAVVHNQDNREHDILDSDDYYQFQGGMANAIFAIRGREVPVWHLDHSNPQSPRARTLTEEIGLVVRSRVLNPKWQAAMRRHGYKGGAEMAATVDYLFAWGATTRLVADHQYRKTAESLLFDRANRDFLQRHNPAALEEMAERLLEASQRGLWRDAGDCEQRLRDLLLDCDSAREGGAGPGH